MEGDPPNRMIQYIVATRYAPLVLPQPLNHYLAVIIVNTFQGLMDMVRLQLKNIGMLILVMLTTEKLNINMCGCGSLFRV